jgi:hypothetical protein
VLRSKGEEKRETTNGKRKNPVRGIRINRGTKRRREEHVKRKGEKRKEEKIKRGTEKKTMKKQKMKYTT